MKYITDPNERAAIRAQGLCPDCGTPMIPAGKRAFICPNQADQGNGISPEQRASVKQTAAARVPNLPF